MKGGEAGDALQITFLNRRSVTRKHPISPEVLQEENALIGIRRQYFRRAKAAISQIIADRHEGTGILGKMGDFRIGLAVSNDRTSQRASPVHQDKVRTIGGNGLIGACGSIAA
ncbi:hypothetical protein D3C87_1201190 [compost metagenome]